MNNERTMVIPASEAPRSEAEQERPRPETEQPLPEAEAEALVKSLAEDIRADAGARISLLDDMVDVPSLAEADPSLLELVSDYDQAIDQEIALAEQQAGGLLHPSAPAEAAPMEREAMERERIETMTESAAALSQAIEKAFPERAERERVIREKEAALAAAIAEVAALEEGPASASEVALLSTESGGRGIYKPVRGEDSENREKTGITSEQNMADREWLVFQIDRALGFKAVPVTVLRDGPGGIGSCQEFVKNDEVKCKEWKTQASRASIEVVAVLDALDGQMDRTTLNQFVDAEGNLIAIDNGITFAPNEGDLMRDAYPQELLTQDTLRQLQDFDDWQDKSPGMEDQARRRFRMITSQRVNKGAAQMEKNDDFSLHTSLSEPVRQELQAFLSAPPEVRKALKECFTLALGSQAEAAYATFMARAERLVEHGFAPHMSATDKQFLTSEERKQRRQAREAHQRAEKEETSLVSPPSAETA